MHRHHARARLRRPASSRGILCRRSRLSDTRRFGPLLQEYPRRRQAALGRSDPGVDQSSGRGEAETPGVLVRIRPVEPSTARKLPSIDQCLVANSVSNRLSSHTTHWNDSLRTEDRIIISSDTRLLQDMMSDTQFNRNINALFPNLIAVVQHDTAWPGRWEVALRRSIEDTLLSSIIQSATFAFRPSRTNDSSQLKTYKSLDLYASHLLACRRCHSGTYARHMRIITFDRVAVHFGSNIWFGGGTAESAFISEIPNFCELASRFSRMASSGLSFFVVEGIDLDEIEAIMTRVSFTLPTIFRTLSMLTRTLILPASSMDAEIFLRAIFRHRDRPHRHRLQSSRRTILGDHGGILQQNKAKRANKDADTSALLGPHVDRLRSGARRDSSR